MKRLNWYVGLGTSLILASLVFYLLQVEIFHKTEDTFFYMLQDLAFLPLQVLLVTLVLNEMMSKRERRAMLNKMNMVIGAFFSEVGTKLLKSFSDFDAHNDRVQNAIVSNKNWSDQALLVTKKAVRDHDYGIDSKRGSLDNLKEFLIGRRGFLLRLLENPNLLEHESFTELLWAVLHLTEELAYRTDLNRLSDADHKHIGGDIQRAYVLLLSEWLDYVRHLRDVYPYIFSLVVRTNPYDPSVSPEIK